jgi:hypothetical protein
MKTPISILFFICVFFFQSCTKPVDFDQIDDAVIETNYILTQVFFDLKASSFLDDFGDEIHFQSNLIETPLGEGSDKYLEKIEFTVVTENEFNRAFDVSIRFYDATGNLIYTLSPSVVIAPNSGATTTIIEIPNEDIDIVFNAQYIDFLLTLFPASDGSTISPNDTSVLNFKSFVTLFLNYSIE